MKIIVWKEYGQLGNRLLTFSSLIALGLHKNWSIYNPSFKDFAPSFDSFNSDIVPCFRPNESSSAFDILLNSKLFWNLTNILLRKKRILDALRNSRLLLEADDLSALSIFDIDNLLLDYNKFFLVWSAWALSFDDLREQYKEHLVSIFKPRQSILDTVNNNFSGLSPQKLTIGVHIRRGDYVNFQDGKYFFSFESYFQLIFRLADLHGPRNVQFIISSNEHVPDHIFSQISGVTLSGSAMEDMYTLSKCDLIVGPPSTFSEWAAFYGSTKRLIFTGQLPLNL